MPRLPPFIPSARHSFPSLHLSIFHLLFLSPSPLSPPFPPSSSFSSSLTPLLFLSHFFLSCIHLPIHMSPTFPAYLLLSLSPSLPYSLPSFIYILLFLLFSPPSLPFYPFLYIYPSLHSPLTSIPPLSFPSPIPLAPTSLQ